MMSLCNMMSIAGGCFVCLLAVWLVSLTDYLTDLPLHPLFFIYHPFLSSFIHHPLFIILQEEVVA